MSYAEVQKTILAGHSTVNPAFPDEQQQKAKKPNYDYLIVLGGLLWVLTMWKKYA